ncbi:probable cytochrome P450 9f2 [Cydia splendana]|uniref:probable cytochrome P450 9f2 n=1 Tax=Cydia splendana TaxID=1100963 RepID=UPI00300C817D
MFSIYLLIGACVALSAWLYRNYSTLSRHGIKHGPFVPLLGDMAGVLFTKEHIADVVMRAYERFPQESTCHYRNYSTLSRHGIKLGPFVPLLGDMAGVLFSKEHIADVVMRAYEKFPQERLVGRYEFLTPYVMVKDLNLLKRITVTDFNHFVDRISVDAKADPIFNRMLLCLRGDEWKEMRSALSPVFTSSKIRLMVPFMVQVGDHMIRALKTKIEQSEVDYIDLQAKDLTRRFANDVIATCVFGLDVNSQYEENDFFKMGKELTTVTFIFKMRFLGFMIVPSIMSALQLTVFSQKVIGFFTNVVLGAIKQREEQNIYRPDMIHLLMEAKKGKLAHDTKSTKDDHAGFATVEESDVGKVKNKTVWTDFDLVAQAVIFLFPGYDTVASTMSFLLYELAVNPDCQERLFREIQENEEKNGKIDYNSVQHMTYLDMVISEVLRKWPGSISQTRVCVKDYNLGKPNDKATKDVILRKGEAVQIPMWAYHRDPKYFPDPEKFDPERFSVENKHKIDPVAYMPFGLGPRNCIASRFALCEIKVMAYQLLLHMEVTPCEKTIIPITLSAQNGFRMSVTGGNWVRFRPRKNGVGNCQKLL